MTPQTQSNTPASQLVASVAKEASKEKRLYKSTNRFCTVHTPKGHALHFKMGMFVTDNQDYIFFLDQEIAAGGFAAQIYIDPNARTVTAEQENPMLALRKKFFQEFLEEQQKFMNPENDMGETKQGPINAASTTDIAPVAAGGGPANATLVALKAQLAAKN